MGEFSRAVTLDGTSGPAKAILINMAEFDQWLPSDWGNLEPITQTQLGKGARATFSVDALGLTLPSEIEITEVGPALVRWSVAIPPIEMILIWTLEETGGETTARLNATWQSRKLPPWRVRTLARIRLKMDPDISRLIDSLPEALKQRCISTKAAPVSEAVVAEEPVLDGGVLSAGMEADLKPGTPKVVKAAGFSIAVFKIDGQIFAIDNDCPHRQGPLAQGQVQDTVVTCPLHRRRFDLKDGSCLSHPRMPTRAYTVRVDGPEIFIEVE